MRVVVETTTQADETIKWAIHSDKSTEAHLLFLDSETEEVLEQIDIWTLEPGIFYIILGFSVLLLTENIPKPIDQFTALSRLPIQFKLKS